MKLIEELKQTFNAYTAGTLAYRPICRADVFPLMMASENELFNEKLWWGPPESLEEALEEVDKLITEYQTNTSLVLSVVERDNGKWVGIVKFSEWEDTLIMSLWTHPDYWRSMAPFRCAESAIDIILKNSNVPYLYARITKSYPTMEKMVLTNGFVFHSDSIVKHAKGHDVSCNVFKLTRENWSRTPKIQKY